MRGQVRVYQRKLVAKKRRRAFYYTFYALCLLALVVAGLSYVSQLESLSIRDVKARGNALIPTSDVEKIVWENLSGNYGLLFARRNAFIYPREAIQRQFEALSSVKSVDVSREGLGTVVVSIEERRQRALWCEDGRNDPLCYLVDGNGLIFAPELDPATTTDAFVYRGLISEDPIGKNLLPESEFKKIEFFVRELSGLSLDPREAKLSDTGLMTVVLASGGRLVVNTRDDLSTVLGNISAVISDRKIAPDLAKFLETLDYIKFDAGNKVVYKVR